MLKTLTLALLFSVGCAGTFGAPATTPHHTLYTSTAGENKPRYTAVHTAKEHS